jgi:hypothetical protein
VNARSPIADTARCERRVGFAPFSRLGSDPTLAPGQGGAFEFPIPIPSQRAAELRRLTHPLTTARHQAQGSTTARPAKLKCGTLRVATA